MIEKFDEDFRYVENGLFKVYKNGDIYRITKNGIRKCKKHKSNKDGKYLNVSTMVNGKQKHFYVHRLIAKAFIPNPSDKLQVNHIDGNGLNNSIDNLEWVTPYENVTHAIETGLTDWKNWARTCSICNKLTVKKEKICPECASQLSSINNNRITHQKIVGEATTLSQFSLTKKQKEVIDYRLEGKTYKEISGILGITQQAVSNRIKGILLKNDNSLKEVNDLKRIRSQMKITQKELAYKLGISKFTYNKKENGCLKFTDVEISKLTKILKTSEEKLFGYLDHINYARETGLRKC